MHATLLLVVAAVSAQDTTFFAVRTPTGHVIQTGYVRGRFVPAVVMADRFPAGEPVPGITTTGARVSVIVDSLVLDEQWMGGHFYSSVQGDLPAAPGSAVWDTMRVLQDSMNATFQTGSMPSDTLLVRYSAVSRRAISQFATYGHVEAVLFWHGPAQISPIMPVPAVLTAADSILLAKEQLRLWNRALTDLPPDEREQHFTVGRIEGQVVPGSDVVWVWSQALATDGDTRGSFCVAFSRPVGEILFSTYGHPEWSPNSAVVSTRPYFWVEVAGDKRTYVVAEQDRAWEDYTGSWVIIDAGSGSVVATSR